MKTLIVTTLSKDGDVLRSQLWNTARPLGLGYPFRWVFEKTNSGMRVRELQSLDVRNLSEGQMKKGFSLFTNAQIRLSPLRSADQNPDQVIPVLPFELLDDSKEFNGFRKSLMSSIGILCFVLLGIVLIPMPKPNEEELIPPQFAKVIL